MAAESQTGGTKSYQHLPTVLRSPTHPMLLRTFEPGDAAALAQILSDPRNTDLEADSVPRQMELATAESVVGRFRESAAEPTVVSAETGRVLSGPGRVNMVVEYLGEGEGEGGVVVGLGGFGSMKDLDAASGEPVAGDDMAAAKAARPWLRVGDVGAMINSEYRGKGLAAEAVRLAMEWAFRPAADGGAQLDKVTACTDARNAAMVAVLERKLAWKGSAPRPSQAKEGEQEITFEMTAAEWTARG